jgi:hypothetical protein
MLCTCFKITHFTGRKVPTSMEVLGHEQYSDFFCCPVKVLCDYECPLHF